MARGSNLSARLFEVDAQPAPAIAADQVGPTNRVTAEMVGRRHLGLASRSAREARGQVYTPPDLVEFVLGELGRPGGPAGPMLDPACGCGAFLEGLVRRLARKFAAERVDVGARIGRQRFLDTVEATIFGVDIDHSAVLEAADVVRATVTAIAPGPLPEGWFSRNVAAADFLLDDVQEILGLADAPAAIVGNPPYVTTTKLDPTYKDQLRHRFEFAHGRLDLYTLFIERAAQLLPDGGRFAFITPDKFLVSRSAAPLRASLVARGALVGVSIFDEHDAFHDAATVPCVTVWESGSIQEAVAVQRCATVSGGGDVLVRNATELSSARVMSAEWYPRATSIEPLLARLAGSHRRLAACVGRLSAGLATGLNAVMVIRAEDVPAGEEELWRPAIRGRDITAFHLHDPGLAVLVPYDTTAPSPTVVDLRQFPQTWALLEARRGELEQRHCVRVWGKAWFDVHDPVPGPIDTTPKLVVPDVARHNRFAFDPGRYWPLHSAYYLTCPDLDPVALLAILNSTAVECMVRAYAPRVKDGFSRYRRQFLLDLPIPEFDEGFVEDVNAAVYAGDPALAVELADALFGVPVNAIRRALEDLNDTGSHTGSRRAP
jgi:adenine-specific DNA-methyltransferase